MMPSKRNIYRICFLYMSAQKQIVFEISSETSNDIEFYEMNVFAYTKNLYMKYTSLTIIYWHSMNVQSYSSLCCKGYSNKKCKRLHIEAKETYRHTQHKYPTSKRGLEEYNRVRDCSNSVRFKNCFFYSSNVDETRPVKKKKIY